MQFNHALQTEDVLSEANHKVENDEERLKFIASDFVVLGQAEIQESFALSKE